MTRCPAGMIREANRPDLVAAVNAYSQYELRGTLPVAGGWLDQAEGFGAVVRFIDAVRPLWAEESGKAGERAESEKKAAEILAKYGRKGA